jgi:hypothetical protein
MNYSSPNFNFREIKSKASHKNYSISRKIRNPKVTSKKAINYKAG